MKTMFLFWVVLTGWLTPPVQDVEFSPWRVKLGEAETEHPVQVPGTIEDQIDVNFDGVSHYITTLKPILLHGDQRLLIRFEGAATLARVYLNDEFLGQHLGAWTPFTIDATTAARRMPVDQPWQLRVEVDEKVGHNTQGFLPIVTHHFGGLWRPVSARISASSHVLVPDAVHVEWLARDRVKIHVPVSGPADAPIDCRFAIRPKVGEKTAGAWQLLASERVQTRTPPRGDPWIQGAEPLRMSERVLETDMMLPWPVEPWSPHVPQLYEFRIELLAGNSRSGGDESALVVDQTVVTSGYRTMTTQGDHFVLNEKPIVPRGVLNWGYSPPSVAPSLDEDWMRRELEFVKQRGFNLMKFCLWIPPKRYLELCDEMGVLAWIEYPTWHPRLDGEHLLELQREYAEFYEYDRNHPSVVLRSLTCETGPSAELAVIQSLYDLCKAYVPGALVVDDSSWISWNRVYDFFDDHPYGNNHTWVDTLTRLRSYIEQRETKPLMLGEAIAADSWTFPSPQLLDLAESSPAHGPWFVVDNLRWQNQLADLAARRGRQFKAHELTARSIHYGMLMRKYQVETYRREIPFGGYVVSVIRDFPKAAMGLIDFENRPKNSPSDWAFQGDVMILMKTDEDRRSFVAGERAVIDFIVAADGYAPIGDGCALELALVRGDSQIEWQGTEPLPRQNPYRARQTVAFQLPTVTAPERMVIRARFIARHQTRQSRQVVQSNSWPVWVFPKMAIGPDAPVQVHPSAADLIPRLELESKPIHDGFNREQIVFTRVLNNELLDLLEKGGKVWLVPNGEPGSFPVADHWFLRGSVISLPRAATVGSDPLEPMINELQHFDLASQVVPQMDHYLQRTDPIVLLWDNHDRREVLTHGLAFRMGVGESGELFVSPIAPWGPNPASRWISHRWFKHLQAARPGPEFALQERMENLALLRSELNRKTVAGKRPWRFQPDPAAQGKNWGWHQPDFDDVQWASVEIDRHWEGQGYAELDGWAWYRTTFDVPLDWDSSSTYLNFTGIDDYADIYVNGHWIGAAGDIESRRTAFDERISLNVSQHVVAGQPLHVAVAVYDWFGAGGIFRPVTLSTEPLSDRPPILK